MLTLWILHCILICLYIYIQGTKCKYRKKKFSNAHEWLLQVLQRTDSPIKSYIFYYLSDVLFSQKVCVLKLSKVNLIKIKWLLDLFLIFLISLIFFSSKHWNQWPMTSCQVSYFQPTNQWRAIQIMRYIFLVLKSN